SFLSSASASAWYRKTAAIDSTFPTSHRSPPNATVTRMATIEFRVRTAASVDTAYRMAKLRGMSGTTANTPGAHTPDRITVISQTPPTTNVDRMRTKNSPPKYLNNSRVVRLIGFDKSITTDPGRSMFGMKKAVTMTAIKMMIIPPTELMTMSWMRYR